jgi:hypothetical protein
MILVCLTTDRGDDFRYALLNLRPMLATSLLRYRSVYERVNDFDSSLYALEFFDNEVDYGSGLVEYDDEDLEGLGEDGWRYIGKDTIIVGELLTAVETIKIVNTGVLWSASPKHGEGYFETPEISWEALEEVAAGRNPFRALGAAEETPGG